MNEIEKFSPEEEAILDLFDRFVANNFKRPKPCGTTDQELVRYFQSPEFTTWYGNQVKTYNILSMGVSDKSLREDIRITLKLKLRAIGKQLLKIHDKLVLVGVKTIPKILVDDPPRLLSCPISLSDLGMTKEEITRRINSLIEFNLLLSNLTQDELQDKQFNMELQKQRLKYNTFRRICLNSSIIIPEIPEIPYPEL